MVCELGRQDWEYCTFGLSMQRLLASTVTRISTSDEAMTAVGVCDGVTHGEVMVRLS